MLILASLVFVAFDSLWSVPPDACRHYSQLGFGPVCVQMGQDFPLGGAALDVAVLVSCRLLSLPLPGGQLSGVFPDQLSGGCVPGGSGTGSCRPVCAYAGMFPRLIAGPIARAGQVVPELEAPECTLQRLERGAGLVILGLAYKGALGGLPRRTLEHRGQDWV